MHKIYRWPDRPSLGGDNIRSVGKTYLLVEISREEECSCV